MYRPIIGMAPRFSENSEGQSYIYTFESGRRALLEAGGSPFLILPPQNIEYAKVPSKEVPRLTEEEKEILRNYVDICDGIFLPGGSKWREYDFFITRYALEKDIPILGVCMGMQLLSKIDNQNGGADVPSTVRNENEALHQQKDAKYVHSVKIKKGTLLYEIIKKEEIRVNSLHNYHVPSVSSYKESAYSEDGLLEGVEDPTKRFVLGVQWHPEKMFSYDVDAKKILFRFTKEARKYHEEKIAIKEKVC